MTNLIEGDANGSFVSIARRVLAHKLENYSLIDVVNSVLEMEELSINASERADGKLHNTLSKMYRTKMYRNFDVTKITDSNEDLIDFFQINVWQPKIETLMTIIDIEYDEGIINYIKG